MILPTLAFVHVYLQLLACNFVQETGIKIKAYAYVHVLFICHVC